MDITEDDFLTLNAGTPRRLYFFVNNPRGICHPPENHTTVSGTGTNVHMNVPARFLSF